MATFYEVLGVSRSASPQDLRVAFKRQALRVHPDKGGSKEAFQQVLVAFEVLSDSASRAQYDDRLLKLGNAVRVAARAREKGLSARNAAADGVQAGEKAHTDGLRRAHNRRDRARASHYGFGMNCTAGFAHRTDVSSTAKTECSGEGKEHAEQMKDSKKKTMKAKKRKADEEQSRKKTEKPEGRTDQGCRGGKRRHQKRAPESCGGVESQFELASRRRRGTNFQRKSIWGGSRERLRTLFALLQRLSAPRRRWALREELSQRERLDLEAWAVAARNRTSSTAAESATRQGETAVFVVPGCFSTGNDDQMVTLHDSASESEQFNEALAVCDDTPRCSGVVDEALSLDQSSSDDSDANGPLMDGDILPASSEFKHMLEDGVVEEKAHRPFGGVTKGILNVYGRSEWYLANVNIRNLRVSSRKVVDLTLAVDLLVALTDLKQRIAPCKNEEFEDCVRQFLPEVLKDHELSAEDTGLTFSVSLHMKCWFPARASVEHHTPASSDLEGTLAVWRLLDQFSWRREWPRRGIRKDRRLGVWMHGLHEEWPNFRCVYVDILASFGTCRNVSASRLDDLEKASDSYRQRHIEEWNRQTMAAEERWQRKVSGEQRTNAGIRWNRVAMAAEERRQRRFEAQEKLLQRRCRKAMAAEERRQRRLSIFERQSESENRRAMAREDRRRKSEEAEELVVQRIRKLVGSWRGAQAKRAASQKKRDRRRKKANHSVNGACKRRDCSRAA
eukprot:TRINITY_DN77139_c0_g1_i1.p1 TRINITY_DN77139_c0_g1~~TRINITY_DN77139_c0_g1_i1.p1  ORF type:complete len:732 (-),score=120.74 TRINITY_DN77139_c0_g1_i1:56-2251(-)